MCNKIKVNVRLLDCNVQNIITQSVKPNAVWRARESNEDLKVIE